MTYPANSPMPGTPAHNIEGMRKDSSDTKVYIALAVCIVIALFIGFFAGLYVSHRSVVEATQRAEQSESDRKSAVDAYDQVMKYIQETQKQNKADSKTKHMLSVTGGTIQGEKYGSGYIYGVITVRNDGDVPAFHVSITVSTMDAGGKITGETYGQLQAPLQPGKSADIEFMIGPENVNVTEAQASLVSYSLDNDGNGFTDYSVSGDTLKVR